MPTELCARKLHPMTEDNRWRGTDRCIKCKRENDRVLYEKKKAERAAAANGMSGADLEAVRDEAARAARGKVAAALGNGTRPAAYTPVIPDDDSIVWASPPVPEPFTLDEPPAIGLRAGYRTRELAGMRDIDALQAARAERLAVLFYGPPGAGKTQLVLNAFPDAVSLHGDGDTLVEDFVGGWSSTGKADEFVWIDGPLLVAMRNGLPFFADDCTLVPPKVLAVMYPVMDGRGVVQVKGHPVLQEDGTWGPDVVTAEEGFFVIGGHNPGVHGAILSEALASRFAVHVGVTTDFDIVRSLGVSINAVKLAENMTTMLASNEVRWVPQTRDLLNFQRIADTLGADAALRNIIGLCPEEDRPIIRERCKDIFGAEADALALGKEMA